MRSRALKDWIDDDKIFHRDLVWFGSYGKNIQAEKQILTLTANTTLVTGTIQNQTFTLTFKNTANTTINFYNSNDEIIDFYTATPGTYNLIGTLTQPLAKVGITYSNFDSSVPIVLTLNEYATAKFYKDDDKHFNFSDEQEAVRNSLTQKISVLEKELWYSINYGMPILNKLKSKLLVDSFVGSVISENPDVISIDKFDSKMDNKVYHCYIKLTTTFGQLTLNM